MLMTAVILIMKESLAPERVVPLRWQTILHNYRALFAHRGFMAHSLAGGFGQAGMFAYIIGSPRVFIELYGVPPQYFGLLFGANALSLIVCSQISARLLRTHPPRLLQRRALTALACASLAAVALTVAGWMSLPLLMLCLIGYMGSQGFVNPTRRRWRWPSKESAWAPPRPCWGRFNCPAARWPDSPSAPGRPAAPCP